MLSAFHSRIFTVILPGFLSLSSAAQKMGAEANPYILNPTPATVAWGYYWSEAPPVLHVQSGDYVKVRTLLTSNPERLEAAGVAPDQVEKELRDVQAVKDRGPGGHVLTGPIYVEGAEPGDVLEVRFQSIDLAIPYGYNAIGQNGFLSDEIFGRKMRIVPLDKEKMIGHFADGIDIPLHPFFGSVGVAPPKEVGRWNSAPPWINAGNLDNKELVAGSVLFIPVYVKGALLEIGDGHAAHVITMGCDRDLNAATHIAVREMISYLMEEKKMSREDAYMLCSVAVDVDITQLVDGNVGVHAMLPKAIFVKK
jgi:acetamidase/formamidase